MLSTKYFKFVLVVGYLCCLSSINAQNSIIAEEVRSLKTYPFSDPDPVPILTDNPKIYPYFKYEGYSSEGKPQDWKVIKLENDLVEVYVLPEVGGKVWGAIEKSTGEEFIYRNEVMKFRNISMRGPWTSGGIEFNFGIIGHHPSTATPVDYVIQKEEDGSVSCTVGNIDLPSRTQWRVKIILPKDKALFETEAHWYNPTAMQQSYYNWMTGAAPARQDFEFFTPGDEYLTHPGEAKPWPRDDMGRDLSLYKENNFGPSKSYHVVGEYNDFFGGYYHDAKYGFGHWGEYEAIPGQKLWLWNLSRAGGIWEDLLTDTDGQYIEFQAGRLFVQYSPGSHINPVTQATFEPYSQDIWRELWFPVKEIGGMSEVSELAVMNVEETGDQIQVGINTFQESEGVLQILGDGKELYREEVSLEAMEVFLKNYDRKGAKEIEVKLEDLDLHYTSDPTDRLIERPFDAAPFPQTTNSAEKLYKEGMEAYKYREYAKAKTKFEQALEYEPRHSEVMIALGEYYYRSGQYDKGLTYVKKALQLDTYDAHANYVAGILYRGKGDWINAKESLGWAARSMKYRSNASAQMAEILLTEGKYAKADIYADKALAFNRFNMNAWMIYGISKRKFGHPELAIDVYERILEIDPLNHFARFERYLISKSDQDKKAFQESHRSELAFQTYLELAIDYVNKGQKEEAKEVLGLAPPHALIELWKAYLGEEEALDKMVAMSPDRVFPFRRETLHALEWAQKEREHWKLDYYLALNLWGKDRTVEAARLMQKIKDPSIKYAPFYQARADLLQKVYAMDPYKDLEKAFDYGRKDWRNWRSMTAYYAEKGMTDEALKHADRAQREFPDNYAVGMDYADALIQSGQYDLAIEQLQGLKVLPFEGASAGRKLYEQAHYRESVRLIQQKKYKAAIKLLTQSKEWPENLGVGKPFDPDERIPDFLLAHCYDKLGNNKMAMNFWQLCAKYSRAHINQSSLNHALALASIKNTYGEDQAMALLQLLLNTNHGKSVSTQWMADWFTGQLSKETESEIRNKVMIQTILMLK